MTTAPGIVVGPQGVRPRAVKRIVWQSLLLVGFLALVFGLVFTVLADPLVAGLIGAKGRVAELGISYLRINSGTAFTGFFLLQLTSLQRALGSAKTPMVLLVLSNVLNVFRPCSSSMAPAQRLPSSPGGRRWPRRSTSRAWSWTAPPGPPRWRAP